MVKIIGLICVLCACTMMGFHLAQRMKIRLEMMIQIRFVLEEICSNAVYGHELLPEIILSLIHKNHGIIKDWLEILSQLLREMDFGLAWKQSMSALKGNILREKDIEVVELFGVQIMNRDSKRLQEVVQVYVNTIEEYIGFCREEYASKARLYQSLGILGGVFIVIIII
ncbi:MAG: stage III sporulation protein AB [Lachnospiraceae bacterium]